MTPVFLAIFNRFPQDVVAISARPYGQRAVLKFAQYTGCLSIAGRFTPGTFTNQITKQFREPRLLIITDPRPDSQVRMRVPIAYDVEVCPHSTWRRGHWYQWVIL